MAILNFLGTSGLQTFESELITCAPLLETSCPLILPDDIHFAGSQFDLFIIEFWFVIRPLSSEFLLSDDETEQQRLFDLFCASQAKLVLSKGKMIIDLASSCLNLVFCSQAFIPTLSQEVAYIDNMIAYTIKINILLEESFDKRTQKYHHVENFGLWSSSFCTSSPYW